MTGKYDLFGKYLLSIASQTNDLTLSFQHIQDVIQSPLPASASKYPAWWAYEAKPHQPQKLAWQNAGWRVEESDLSRGQVRFRRFSSPTPRSKPN